jgi:hypothetical protein
MKLVKEHIILEKFELDTDPIEDLGIGIIYKIEEWLKSMDIDPENYKINDDLTIDLLKNVDFSRKNIKKLPDYIQFNKTRSFYLHINPLVSLKGCPKYVDGDFACSKTPIATLKYSPKYVSNYFYIHDCPNLKTLNGIKHVGGKLCMQDTNISEREIKKLINRISIRYIHWTNPITNQEEDYKFKK